MRFADGEWQRFVDTYLDKPSDNIVDKTRNKLQVISNGTDSRYFANTTQRNKNSFDFTMNWAKANNGLIKDVTLRSWQPMRLFRMGEIQLARK